MSNFKEFTSNISDAQQLQALAFDHLHDGVIVTDLDGHIIDWNRGAQNMFGYTKEEVLGQKPSMLHKPQESPILIEEIMSALSEKGEWAGEINYVKKDGTFGFCETTVVPLKDPHGAIIATVGVNHDVTERKKQEIMFSARNLTLEKLALGSDLEEVLTMLVHSMDELMPGLRCSVLLLDKSGKYFEEVIAPHMPDFYNEALIGFEIGPNAGSCGVAAYRGERFVVEDVMTHPNWEPYRELAEKVNLRACWSEPIKLSTGKVAGTFAMYYDHPRGPEHSESEYIKTSAHIAGIAIEQKRNEEAANHSHHEIERKAKQALLESEQYNRRLFEESVIGLVLCRMNGELVDVNQAYASILGRSIEETLELTYWDITPKKYAKDEEEQLKSLNKTGRYGPYEKEYIHKDGYLVPVRLSGILLEKDGETFIWSSVEDITERQKIEDQLKSYSSKLERSQAELRNLSAHLLDVMEQEKVGIAREIHDELGQILTALKMDLGWIKRHASDSEESIIKKADEMSSTIDSSIKMVRKVLMQLRPSLLDDLGLVAAIEWQAHEFEERLGIGCEISFSHEEIDLDDNKKTAVFRIVQEALTNVARHAKASHVDISIRVINNELLLKIEDDGRGIDSTEVEHTESFGLLGMKERVRLLSGAISIEGQKDKGTVITVSLPLKKRRSV